MHFNVLLWYSGAFTTVIFMFFMVQEEDKIMLASIEDDHLHREESQIFLRNPILSEVGSRRYNISGLSETAFNCTNPLLLSSPLNQGIHMLVSFYRGDYGQSRFGELLWSLRRNLGNPEIAAVHVFFEDEDPIAYLNKLGDHILLRKLIRIDFKQQPTYKDFFEYADKYLHKGAIAIIANSDVYFDHTLACARGIINPNATKMDPRMAYALSRHPAPHFPCDKPGKDLCEDYHGSHDAFIFAPPMPLGFASRVDFFQNRKGAENIVIYEFRQLKRYQLQNPCFQIKLFHLHCSQERNYPGLPISRGKGRLGDFDRHKDAYPRLIECPASLSSKDNNNNNDDDEEEDNAHDNNNM